MSEKARHNLPGILAYIAEEVGEDVAVKLATERGGRSVYIPKTPNPRHALAKLVGQDAAEKLTKLLGHGNLLVPCGSLAGAGRRRVKIIELSQQGLSHAQIAAEVDVHTRTVERVMASLKSDDQLELPF